MKRVFTLLCIGFLSFYANAQQFKFEEEIIDYGEIEQDSNGEKTFVFTNIGDKPLIIEKAKSSCGCTVPEKPEKPVLPGEKGEIKVSYNTHRIGVFYKSITLTSNTTDKIKVIKIKGVVKKPLSLEKENSLLKEK